MQPISPDIIAAADRAAGRALLRGGSRSFHVASRLLPRRVRDPAIALYGFCRLADDAIDAAGADPAVLAELEERLDAACRGRPRAIAADRAFAAVVERFAIPHAVPAALLEGFAWDARRRRYQDLDELEAYAARVAGSVGVMMARVMGADDPASLARAADLGVAMQLTNIARDVGEDARLGRLYLPERWLREVGIDPEAWLARPVFSPELGTVVARLLAAADRLYRRADSGIARLPAGCRPGIRAARLLYHAIGEGVARRGHDSVSSRAVVPARDKALLLARLLWPAIEQPGDGTAPPLEAVRFLLDAMPPSRMAPRGVVGRMLWLIDLFERLERRDESLALARRPVPPG